MNKEFKPFLKKIFYLNLWSFLISVLFIILAIVLVFVLLSPSEMILYFVIGFGFLLIAFIGFDKWLKYLRYKNTKYSINKDKMEKVTNFLSYNKVSIPSVNVTNISYTRNIIFDRIFGTGTLEFYTSGSSSVDLVMRDVRGVEKIYDSITKLLGLTASSKHSLSGENIERKSKSFLFRIKPDKKAVKLGLVFAAFQALFLAFILSIFVIPPIYSLLTDPFSGVIAMTIPIIFIIFIAFVGYIIFAYLTLKRFDRMYYDFYTDKLEYYDGFMTLRKASIPFERITNISSRESIIDKLLGVSSIDIETAGSSGSNLVIKSVREGKESVKILKEELKKNGKE